MTRPADAADRPVDTVHPDRPADVHRAARHADASSAVHAVPLVARRSTVPIYRRRTILLTVVAILAIAGPAAANHVFGDVPATHIHHAAIDELSGAGITSGCAPNAFCPGQAVTRGQMATFLRRGATRVSSDHSVTTLALGSGSLASGVPVTVEVDLAGASGGTANLALQGNVTVTATAGASDCPCEVEAFIYRASDDAQGPSSWSTLTAGEASVAVPVGWGLTIPSNARHEYRVAVFVDGVSDVAPYRAEGNLTAVSGPFGDTQP
jgi:hypothetical protein